MDLYGWVALGFGMMIALLVFLLGFIIVKQQLTIDRLTDKLLGIQPSIKGKKTEIVEEDASPKEDEPKGWYDH